MKRFYVTQKQVDKYLTRKKKELGVRTLKKELKLFIQQLKEDGESPAQLKFYSRSLKILTK